MKASTFSDAQTAFILKQVADGVPVAAICRKARGRCQLDDARSTSQGAE